MQQVQDIHNIYTAIIVNIDTLIQNQDKSSLLQAVQIYCQKYVNEKCQGHLVLSINYCINNKTHIRAITDMKRVLITQKISFYKISDVYTCDNNKYKNLYLNFVTKELTKNNSFNYGYHRNANVHIATMLAIRYQDVNNKATPYILTRDWDIDGDNKNITAMTRELSKLTQSDNINPIQAFGATIKSHTKIIPMIKGYYAYYDNTSRCVNGSFIENITNRIQHPYSYPSETAQAYSAVILYEIFNNWNKFIVAIKNTNFSSHQVIKYLKNNNGNSIAPLEKISSSAQTNNPNSAFFTSGSGEGFYTQYLIKAYIYLVDKEILTPLTSNLIDKLIKYDVIDNTYIQLTGHGNHVQNLDIYKQNIIELDFLDTDSRQWDNQCAQFHADIKTNISLRSSIENRKNYIKQDRDIYEALETIKKQSNSELSITLYKELSSKEKDNIAKDFFEISQQKTQLNDTIGNLPLQRKKQFDNEDNLSNHSLTLSKKSLSSSSSRQTAISKTEQNKLNAFKEQIITMKSDKQIQKIEQLKSNSSQHHKSINDEHNNITNIIFSDSKNATQDQLLKALANNINYVEQIKGNPIFKDTLQRINTYKDSHKQTQSNN